MPCHATHPNLLDNGSTLGLRDEINRNATQTSLRGSDEIVRVICNKIPFIKLSFVNGPRHA